MTDDKTERLRWLHPAVLYTSVYISIEFVFSLSGKSTYTWFTCTRDCQIRKYYCIRFVSRTRTRRSVPEYQQVNVLGQKLPTLTETTAFELFSFDVSRIITLQAGSNVGIDRTLINFWILLFYDILINFEHFTILTSPISTEGIFIITYSPYLSIIHTVYL